MEKLSKKKSLNGEMTLQKLKDEINKKCYPENDTWFEDWKKEHGEEPSAMFCRWHEDEKYYKFKALLYQAFKEYPHLRKEYELESAQYQLELEISFLKFEHKTKEQIEKDEKIIALKKKIEEIKATDYKEEKQM